MDGYGYAAEVDRTTTQGTAERSIKDKTGKAGRERSGNEVEVRKAVCQKVLVVLKDVEGAVEMVEHMRRYVCKRDGGMRVKKECREYIRG